MTRIALYPGSFDPVTKGHEDIVRRSLTFVDKLVVAVAANMAKEPLFSASERVDMLKEVFKGEARVEVEQFDGLLADFARATGATLVVRGLRAVSDFEYEFQMALMNRRLCKDLETVFLTPAVHLTFLSSSIVREVATLKGDVGEFVNPVVDRALRAKFGY
ncbi:MAG: pantetheine-phosphate adenylyltransferase [Gemmatimonadales bacterium]